MFDELAQELRDLGTDVHPSEVHGMLVGHLCGAPPSDAGARATLYAEWLGAGLSDSLVKLLETAYATALESMNDTADFSFRLLAPDDDTDIDQRARAFAHWCSGFISALGEARAASGHEFSDDLTEMLQDMARIASVSDPVPEGEDNEADLMLIEEYIRVGALLAYAESVQAQGASK